MNKHNQLTFNDGIWWAIETLFSGHEETASEQLLKESHISRDKAIELAKKSATHYPQIINYFDVWVWNLRDIEELDDDNNWIVVIKQQDR